MKTKETRSRVMDDPVLDRLFTEAYRDALARVGGLEQEKRLADHVEAYAELFERDLDARDLSDSERREMVAAFKRRLASVREERDALRRRRRGRALIGGLIAACVLATGGLYLASAQPFKAAAEIERELGLYYAKVDAGTGAYAKRYFALLAKHGSKLGSVKAEDYGRSMRAELDEHFNEYLDRVVAGELQYADDAKAWAKLFPDKEEREERYRAVDNAFQAGLGKAVGATWDTVKKETGSLFEEAGEAVKKLV
ncbi:MAG TPA: hypothetical protein PK179_12885, partial [Spirochaetales bacterium]|nr:hypothetical protein [Spirochaetales bacterium]